jgi:hypothetical protein
MTTKHIARPHKPATPPIEPAPSAIDEKAHAVPEGAAEATPTGTPTSDRHQMETAHAPAPDK